MPRSYDGVTSPSAPSGPIGAWDRGIAHKVEQDWKAVQDRAFPTRALAWNAHDANLRGPSKNKCFAQYLSLEARNGDEIPGSFSQTAITGWRSLDPNSIYRMYNTNGRGEYAGELSFAYDLIKRNKFLQ